MVSTFLASLSIKKENNCAPSLPSYQYLTFTSSTTGVLSLIATVSVSIVIARVETKRAKRQHTEAIQQQVKEFVMDNQSEIDYLPLCVFANAVSPYAANKWQIYNRFNRCTEEVQIEILRHQNIPIGLIKDKNVLDKCLDSFDEQALETKL